MDPFLILFLGVAAVVCMIMVLRLNAFIALISSAMLVSLLSPGEISTKVGRVAEAFGNYVGSIGIVIALAAVIGKCLMDSGAADRIVRSFLRALGERNAGAAFLGSGFVLSVPVFFDTVFYLLVPLARSLCKYTKKNYTLYLLAITAGTAITHTMVPPTPGPLLMASALGIDIGTMILAGMMIGFPTAIVALATCYAVNRFITIPLRPYASQTEPEPLADEKLPRLWVSLLPILLPVFLISANTLVNAFCGAQEAARLAQQNSLELSFFNKLAGAAELLGNANMALLLSAAISMVLLVRSRNLSLADLARSTESALTSGGVIILITAAGGAFGSMLRESGLKNSIMQWVTSDGNATNGTTMLVLAFVVAATMKMAQGSSTVAMITTSAMLAGMGVSSEMLGFHPVYLATATSGGALVGSWMNDSGFWIYSRMGNVTESETLRTWTVILSTIGFTVFGFTLLFAKLLPMT